MPKPRQPFKADLKPLDAMFLGDSEQSLQTDSVINVPVESLSHFKNHPFRLYTGEKMQDMVQSIQEFGIMTPLIVRPHPDGEQGHYEIISGHNRLEGARGAGVTEVPVLIRDVDDARAILMMIALNFEQRESILPSEKAFAFKMQMDAINQQGKRTDLTSAHHAQKLDTPVSRDQVAEKAGVGGQTISRYIRLTELIPSLLEQVDNGKLNFMIGVELSYLKHSEQTVLQELMTLEGIKTISPTQAAMLRENSNKGVLDDMGIIRILHDKPEPLLVSVKMTKRLQEYIPPNTLPKDAENIIVSALDIRSSALSRFPPTIKENEASDYIMKAIEMYNQMGFTHSPSDLARDTQDRKEDEEFEP